MCNQQTNPTFRRPRVGISLSAFRARRVSAKYITFMSSKYITVDDTQATSLAEAKILAKQHEGLHWKVHRKNPGVRGTTAIFQCNSHVNCPRLLRVALIRGVYCIQVRGDHSTEVNLYARSNSSCTFDEQKLLKFGLDSGGKPGGIHSAMTKEMSSVLKLQGKDPLKHKRDEGGLKGARVYVSGVYQVRIRKYQSVYQTTRGTQP